MDDSVAKTNERLSTVINKLKSVLEEDVLKTDVPDSEKVNDDSLKEVEVLTKDANEQLDLSDSESNKNWGCQEDKSLSKSYLMWENNSNLCWLDSSMSLLVHNKTLSHLANNDSSQIAKIIKGYESAISVLNDYSNEKAIEERLLKAKDVLQKIQGSVLEYLKPILKCKEGEPDSAFCSLLNLISENKQVKNMFLVEFSWLTNCSKCEIPRVKNNRKTIITLSKVKTFNPASPVSLYKCPVCETLDQEMELKYKTLPQCLIFHFENGAGEGEFSSLDFELNDRKYKLSGLIKMEKSIDKTVNHFVTWVRDIVSDSWLECNDLNSDVLSFSVIPPFINLKDLYIVMYEALDNKGTVFDVSLDISNTIKINTEDAVTLDIPVIDLSDEEENAEPNQDNQIINGIHNIPVLGGLFKHDKIDDDMTKQLDDILSDNASIEESTQESIANSTVSNKKEISVKKSEEKFSLPSNSLFQTSGKTNVTLETKKPSETVGTNFSKTVNSNLLNVDKIDPKNSAGVNDKQPLLKSTETLNEKKLILSNSELEPTVKPVIENNEKSPNGACAKPLDETTLSIVEVELQTNAKDNAGKKNPAPAENPIGKSCILSSSQKPLISFEDKNKIKNADSPRKDQSKFQNGRLNADSPRKDQNKFQNGGLNATVFTETNKLDLSRLVNIAKDCPQDSSEFRARASGLAIHYRASKRKCVSKYDDSAVKVCKNNTVVDNMDNTTTHVSEKLIETSTLPDTAVHAYFNPKQLQKSDINSSKCSKNLAAVKIKIKKDNCNSDDRSVKSLESETQKVYSKNTFRKTKITYSTSNKQNHISGPLQSILESPNKSDVKANDNSNINKGVFAKHAEYPNKTITEHDGNLTTTSTSKQCLVNSKSEKVATTKLRSSENSSPVVHHITILNRKTVECSRGAITKANEKLNVQSIKSEEISEAISSKKITSECSKKFEDTQNCNLQNQVGTKGFSFRQVYVQLPRLKDFEIANYISDRVNCTQPNQIESSAKLTKTEEEKTSSESLNKQEAEQTDFSEKKLKVESIEPVRKSSRILARRVARKDKTSSLETKTKKSKNSQIKHEDDISTNSSISKSREQILKAPPDVENNSKPQNLVRKVYKTRTRSNSKDHLDAPSTESQSSTKNKCSVDFDVEESLKSAPKKFKVIETVNSDIQLNCPTASLLEAASSSTKSHNEPNSFLKGINLSPNKRSRNSKNKDNEISANNEDKSQPCNESSQSSSVHQPEDRNLKEDTKNSGKYEDCPPDCDCDKMELCELIENTTNCVMAKMFQFFNLHKMKFL